MKAYELRPKSKVELQGQVRSKWVLHSPVNHITRGSSRNVVLCAAQGAQTGAWASSRCQGHRRSPKQAIKDVRGSYMACVRLLSLTFFA